MREGHNATDHERLAAEAFGRWVRRLRTDRGWTQVQLVAEVQRRGGRLDQGTLSRIENGRRGTVGLGIAWALAEALGRRLVLAEPNEVVRS